MNRNFPTKISFVVLAAVVFVGLMSPVSGLRSAAWAEEGFKIGYVDIAELFDRYEHTKRSESALERKGKQKETELERKLAELKKLRDGLELLSEDARMERYMAAALKAGYPRVLLDADPQFTKQSITIGSE